MFINRDKFHHGFDVKLVLTMKWAYTGFCADTMNIEGWKAPSRERAVTIA